MDMYSVLNTLREIEAKDSSVLGSNTISNLKDLAISESEVEEGIRVTTKDAENAKKKKQLPKGQLMADKFSEGCGCGDPKCKGNCGKDGCKCGSKDKIDEANVTISIDDLQSTDMETLSQMLHLAGVADAPSMGMGDVYSPAGDMGMDPMGMDDMGMDDPMDGGDIGPSDIDDMSMDMDEPEDMGMEPDFPSDDYEAGFDAEMGDDMDDMDDGMGMEPMDDPIVDMSPEDDAMVMGDYAEESLEDMLKLSGVQKVQEEDDEVWANEPNERSTSDAMNLPSAGPNKASKHGHGARPGDNPMAVTERTKVLKAKLQMFKEV